MPDIYKDDSAPGLLLAIFNADPAQQLSLDAPHCRAVSAHRFRQILIRPKPADALPRSPLSLMPMLTFTENAQGETTCRPQVIGRLPTLALAESGGETELKSRFLQAWHDSPLRDTIEVRSNEDILGAIKEIEKVAENVSQSYRTSCDIVDSNDNASESLFSSEWYGPHRYEDVWSSTYYALTDFARPIGVKVNGHLKYIGMLQIGHDEPTSYIGYVGPSGLSETDDSVLIDTLGSGGQLPSVDSLVWAMKGCNADIDAANTQRDIETTAAGIRSRLGDEHDSTGMQRGPLHVPVHKLVAAFDALTMVYGVQTARMVNSAFQQSSATHSESTESTNQPTVTRIKLRPVNIFHLNYRQALARFAADWEPYSVI